MALSLRPADKVELAYVAAVGLTVAYLWRDGINPRWPWIATAYVLLATCALLAPTVRTTGPVGRFLGEWYPLILLPAMYGTIGVVNLYEAHVYDPIIQRVELWVFGSQVSYRWVREQPSALLSWVMQLIYLSYYPVIFAAPIGLWVSGRRDAARHTIVALMVTLYFCYLIFMLFPVTGPRYAFDLVHNAATTAAPARLAKWILDRGDSWGAAFPSSHVAGYLVAVGMALRKWRRFGRVLLPGAVGLVPAVVYDQCHYAVDSVAGVIVAAVVLIVVPRWLEARGGTGRPVASVAGVAGVAGMAGVPGASDRRRAEGRTPGGVQ